jgi:predicted  nucleic acid-binding Zn-ribbon protein
MENIQALNKALDAALALSDNLQKQKAELSEALYHVEKDIRDLHKALEDATA